MPVDDGRRTTEPAGGTTPLPRPDRYATRTAAATRSPVDLPPDSGAASTSTPPSSSVLGAAHELRRSTAPTAARGGGQTAIAAATWRSSIGTDGDERTVQRRVPRTSGDRREPVPFTLTAKP